MIYERSLKPIENFLEAFEKIEIFERIKPEIGLEYSGKYLFFELKLFSKALRKFSIGFANMFNVSENSA